MVAVRALLSTLNSLTQSGLQAGRWLPPDSKSDREQAQTDAATGSAPEAWQGEYAEGGIEPQLDELLYDPVIRLMMRADHLEPEQIRALLDSRRSRVEP